MLYCVKRISLLLLIFPFICQFFFFSIKNFLHRILSSYESQSFQILYTPWEGAKYMYIMGKKTKILWLIFAFFFHFSISHSNVIHVQREICVKHFSETTAPRILKFGTNVGYDLLYCVKENQHAALIIPFIYSFFFLSKQIICYKFLSFYESQSLQILYTHWEWPSIVGLQTELLRFIFPFFFPFFHLSLHYNT